MKKAQEKALAYSILIKYVGYALLIISLAVIVIASLLRITIPLTTEAILVGILLIFLGYASERFIGDN